jgi:hypothetical protein
MKRITLVGMVLLLWLTACAAADPKEPATSSYSDKPVVTIYKSPTCGCCGDWVAYLADNGYSVLTEYVDNMTPIKQQYQVPTALQSCHTAIVDGYVIEGHVPVADMERLLSERPDVVGIAVPGMPIGSPGMETPGVAAEPYDVLTFDKVGHTEVYARYSGE